MIVPVVDWYEVPLSSSWIPVNLMDTSNSSKFDGY